MFVRNFFKKKSGKIRIEQVFQASRQLDHQANQSIINPSCGTYQVAVFVFVSFFFSLKPESSTAASPFGFGYLCLKFAFSFLRQRRGTAKASSKRSHTVRYGVTTSSFTEFLLETNTHEKRILSPKNASNSVCFRPK